MSHLPIPGRLFSSRKASYQTAVDGSVQVDRHASIEFFILLEHEECKCAIVAVFILLEIYLLAFKSVVFHCVEQLNGRTP